MLASCIMPTADRRRFVGDSIRRWLGQDYENKELIIVDDGDDPIGDLVPQDNPQIRYVYDKPRRLLGDKRNFCCQLARGEIIVHWDDDDYYNTWRIRRQVDELRKGFDLCGLADPLLYHQVEERAYQLQLPRMAQPWLYGASFAYKKSLWDKHRFDSARHRAEDDHFVNSLQFDQVSIMQQEWGMFIALKHTTNTGMGFELGGTHWRPFPPEIIKLIMREDQFRKRDGETYFQWLPPGL